MKILCVCTGNTCRSPMLMALIRAEAERAEEQSGLNRSSLIQVTSAGTAATTGDPASSYALTCMELRGLDLSGHRSKNVDDLDLTTFDHFLCMTSRHAAALRSRGVPPQKLSVVNADKGGVSDPFGGSLDAYEACAFVLESIAKTVVSEANRSRRI